MQAPAPEVHHNSNNALARNITLAIYVRVKCQGCITLPRHGRAAGRGAHPGRNPRGYAPGGSCSLREGRTGPRRRPPPGGPLGGGGGSRRTRAPPTSSRPPPAPPWATAPSTCDERPPRGGLARGGRAIPGGVLAGVWR
jgi:hypothetical protein